MQHLKLLNYLHNGNMQYKSDYNFKDKYKIKPDGEMVHEV